MDGWLCLCALLSAQASVLGSAVKQLLLLSPFERELACVTLTVNHIHLYTVQTYSQISLPPPPTEVELE